MDIPAQLTQPNPVLDRLEAEGKQVFTHHDGRKISWRIWGQGRPLVFFHGGSGSWKHWVRNIGEFSNDHMVIAPDLPGFGLSDDAMYPVVFEDMGRDVASGLDEILGGPKNYVLSAFSYGGSMTSQMLLVQPGRQDALMLCSAAGFIAPRPPRIYKVRDKVGMELVETHRTNLNSIMIADPAKIDDLAMRVQHENTMLSRLRAFKMDRGVTLRDMLPGFKGKVAACWGDRDGFMAPGSLIERQNMLRDLRPDAEIHILEGVGHWLAYEAADQFNPIMRDFLSRV